MASLAESEGRRGARYQEETEKARRCRPGGQEAQEEPSDQTGVNK